jgi:hypothetical protein
LLSSQKSKQPNPLQQSSATQPSGAPTLNYLFGSDGCLRSHLIQEVIRGTLHLAALLLLICSDFVFSEAKKGCECWGTFNASNRSGALLGPLPSICFAALRRHSGLSSRTQHGHPNCRLACQRDCKVVRRWRDAIYPVCLYLSRAFSFKFKVPLSGGG